MDVNEGVSILIPARNAEKYIRETLESVCRQIERYDEIVIIENSSNDSTKDIINEFQSKDSRIKCFYMHEMVSLFESRKYAISKASCDYLIFLDSDDLLKENALYEIRKAIKEFNKPDMLIYRTIYFNSEGYIDESKNFFGCNTPILLDIKHKEELYNEFFSTEFFNNVWLKCVKRKSVLKAYTDFDGFQSFTFTEDKIHTSIFLNSTQDIVYMPYVLHEYRKHDNAATRKVSIEWIVEFLFLCVYFNDYLKKNSKFEKFSEKCKCLLKTQFCKLLVWYSGQHRHCHKEYKEIILRINSMVSTYELFNRDKSSFLYEFVYWLFRNKKTIMLLFMCKCYVKVKKV